MIYDNMCQVFGLVLVFGASCRANTHILLNICTNICMSPYIQHRATFNLETTPTRSLMFGSATAKITVEQIHVITTTMRANTKHIRMWHINHFYYTNMTMTQTY